jgi:hypothetical protein
MINKLCVFIIAFFLSASFKTFDCTFNSALPFTHGSTKFQVMNKMNELSGFTKNYDGGNYFTYSMEPTSCYDGRNSELRLKFSEDKLYFYAITTNYDMNEYDRMKTNFEMLVKLISSNPIYKYKSKRKLSNSDTKEQIGEGWKFQKVKNYGSKVDNVEITYSIITGKNGNVDYYQIEVSLTNLNGTTLTGDGGY